MIFKVRKSGAFVYDERVEDGQDEERDEERDEDDQEHRQSEPEFILSEFFSETEPNQRATNTATAQ